MVNRAIIVNPKEPEFAKCRNIACAEVSKRLRVGSGSSAMNILDRKKQLLILQLICRQNGISDIVEIVGVSPTTVRHYLARFGPPLLAAHDRLVRNLSCTRVQVDEIWSYVYCKSGNMGDRTDWPRDAGDAWTWTAIDPDSKLFVTWLVGSHDMDAGLAFLGDLRDRVQGRLLITTDGYVVYPSAVEITFGANVDHVMLTKLLASKYDAVTGEREVRVVGMQKFPMNQTKVDLTRASTSLAERHHATMRNFISRLARKSYRFSKKLENHVHAQSVYAFYYNFRKEHRGLPKHERKLTPAMKAGISHKVWTFEDMLDEVDAYWASSASAIAAVPVAAPSYVPLYQDEGSDRPFFVKHDPHKREAKVHRGECVNCRQGVGRKGGDKRTQWFAFEKLSDALLCAETLAPHAHAQCSMCLKGFYRTRKQPV